MIMRHERTGWGKMQSKEREKENIEEGSEKTQKKYHTSREKLEMDLRGKKI